MKKIFLAFALILVSSYTFSQGFTFTRVGPETITISDTNAFEGYIEAILNPNSGSQDIRVIRIIEDLTPSWQPLGTAICNYQSCFPPNTDTVTAMNKLVHLRVISSPPNYSSPGEIFPDHLTKW